MLAVLAGDARARSEAGVEGTAFLGATTRVARRILPARWKAPSGHVEGSKGPGDRETTKQMVGSKREGFRFIKMKHTTVWVVVDALVVVVVVVSVMMKMEAIQV
jgi:hypothetical protein